MKKYEVMYILRSDLESEVISAEVKNIQEIFTKNDSKVLEVKEMGLKELAYEIEKLHKGYYIWMLVEANNKAIEEFNRIVGYNEKVIRHIVVKDGE